MDENTLREILEDEKCIVRATCHNLLQQPMFGERLQDTVIFHLENYTKNIISALNDEKGNEESEEVHDCFTIEEGHGLEDVSCEHGSRWKWWPGPDGKGAWMDVVMASNCNCREPPRPDKKEEKQSDLGL